MLPALRSSEPRRHESWRIAAGVKCPPFFVVAKKQNGGEQYKFSSISGKIAPKKTPSFVREVKIFVVAQARVCSEGGANSLKNIVIYGADIPQIYSFCAKKLAKTVLPQNSKFTVN